MSRRVQLVLVCEDSQQEAFARRFLNLAGWDVRKLRVERSPSGKGAAEHFVRERYPIELEAYRANKHRVARGLIIMTDGDRFGLAGRREMLDQTCQYEGVTPRATNEPVAMFIPTWNIETWLAYLKGEHVDEQRADYPRLERAKDCKPMVETLFGVCKVGELRQPAPESLIDACEEYEKRMPHD